mmetsp:Transcript_37653/g.85502  ORF Transcript_37653/g.85502 Transcript_37653/m.85502 type:complete len:223 (+) Transcript_37653:789-1457(+)
MSSSAAGALAGGAAATAGCAAADDEADDLLEANMPEQNCCTPSKGDASGEARLAARWDCAADFSPIFSGSLLRPGRSSLAARVASFESVRCCAWRSCWSICTTARLPPSGRVMAGGSSTMELKPGIGDASPSEARASSDLMANGESCTAFSSFLAASTSSWICFTFHAIVSCTGSTATLPNSSWSSSFCHAVFFASASASSLVLTLTRYCISYHGAPPQTNE